MVGDDGARDGGVDMRLAASRACSCVARALVSPARDAEHRMRVMHTDRGEARDLCPEVRAGLRRKFRVAETWYAWRRYVWRGITSGVSSLGRRSVMRKTDLGGLTGLRRYAMGNEIGITWGKG